MIARLRRNSSILISRYQFLRNNATLDSTAGVMASILTER
jgi:hypothetical protein